MKTSTFFFLAIGMLFHSCGSGESTETAEPAGDATTTEAPHTIDGHDSQNSLDWMGTYAGVLPCDDCEEVQIEVTLDEKSRYSRKMIYKGKSKTPLLSAGKFEWNKSGSEIILKSFKGNNQVFKVGENKLIYQTPEGESSEYFLSKVQAKEEETV